LIRPASNFSLMAEQLGNFILSIAPVHCDARSAIDEVEVQFNGRAL
jgi:hypothetical protein